MVVSLPLGLLASVPAWDALSISRVLLEATSIAYFTEMVGLVSAGFALLTGIRDLLDLAERPTLLTTGFRHALLAFGALGTMGVSLALRSPTMTPGWTVVLLDLVGAAQLLASAWFGGHLVFHHGVGVDESVGSGERALRLSHEPRSRSGQTSRPGRVPRAAVIDTAVKPHDPARRGYSNASSK